MSKELEESIRFLEIYIEDIRKVDTVDTRNKIKSIETVLQALKNSIPKEVIEEAIKEIERSKNLSSMLIEEKVIIADNDSLYKGQEIAHDFDINILKKILEEQYGKTI